VSPYLRASRLWIITPAPINNTSDSATSHTISKRRVATPIAPSLRPPSLSASLRSDRPARTAGSVPASTPVSIDTPTANSSTRPSIEISSALGTWPASSVEADVRVPYASRSPSAPPAPASSKASAFAWAVMNNRFEIADFLLGHGADINTNWSSHGPASILHELVWHKNYEAMQFLIDRGIDMTILDYRWDGTAQGWAYYAAKDEKMAQ